MRIFVGYHYGPAEVWVKDLVYRLVRAFGDDVQSGEQLYLGPNIVDAITRKIEDCDAVIGVASRSQAVNGFYTSHPWVQDELVVALAKQKLFVQLRETQLDPRLGILQGAQYIEYESAKLGDCLVKLAEAIGQWHSLRNVQLILLPTDFAAGVSPYLDQPGFYCRYTLFNRDFKVKGPTPAQVVSFPGSLRVMLRGIDSEYPMIQLEAGFGMQRWKSDVVSIEDTYVIMKPQ